jgi:hypothetical protein
VLGGIIAAQAGASILKAVIKVALLEWLRVFDNMTSGAGKQHQRLRMRQNLAASAATVSFVLSFACGASAMTVGTTLGIQQGLVEASLVEKVVRICQHNVRTGRRVCWIDRSRPPTVCHVVRERDGTRRLDCY